MCGRITLSTPAARLIELFQLTDFPRMDPHYNIAPTHLVICIRSQENEKQAIPMRWGLVPSWAKDLSIGNRMINARSETAAEKSSFRKAWTHRRCLIPVDGFYEWEKPAKPGSKQKQPWLIHAADNTPFVLAGLWESWQPPESTGETVLTCSILTTSANADMSPVHDRMPVIIPPEHHATWLSASTTTSQLTELTQPAADGILTRYRVSTAVNKATFDSPECIAPLADTESTDLQLF
jgi:putative SOS response-associated peptidase YedK